MRDPNRICKFVDELSLIWENTVPDWRFGQLMYNFMSWAYNEKKIELFFIEEEKYIELLKEYLNYEEYEEEA